MIWVKNLSVRGSGCGSVGGAVTFDTRGPQFESSHRQKFIYTLNICLLSTVYWKDENKEKEAGNGPFKKKFNDNIIIFFCTHKFKRFCITVSILSSKYVEIYPF